MYKNGSHMIVEAFLLQMKAFIWLIKVTVHWKEPLAVSHASINDYAYLVQRGLLDSMTTTFSWGTDAI